MSAQVSNHLFLPTANCHGARCVCIGNLYTCITALATHRLRASPTAIGRIFPFGLRSGVMRVADNNFRAVVGRLAVSRRSAMYRNPGVSVSVPSRGNIHSRCSNRQPITPAVDPLGAVRMAWQSAQSETCGCVSVNCKGGGAAAWLSVSSSLC